jgi:hypothetical protein
LLGSTAEQEGSSRYLPTASTGTGGRPWAARAVVAAAAAALKILRDSGLRHLGRVGERSLEVGLRAALVGQLASEVIRIALR